MLILFLLTSHLKRLLTASVLFENTLRLKGLSKIEFKELSSLATKESFLFLMENSESKSMESLLVHLKVRHWLILF